MYIPPNSRFFFFSVDTSAVLLFHKFFCRHTHAYVRKRACARNATLLSFSTARHVWNAHLYMTPPQHTLPHPVRIEELGEHPSRPPLTLRAISRDTQYIRFLFLSATHMPPHMTRVKCTRLYTLHYVIREALVDPTIMPVSASCNVTREVIQFYVLRVARGSHTFARVQKTCVTFFVCHLGNMFTVKV